MSTPLPTEESVRRKALQKRVLFKLDCHILPPLALVSLSLLSTIINLLLLMLTLTVSSYGWPTSSIEAMSAMQGMVLASLSRSQKDQNLFYSRIAGLETDTHLVGNQFNTVLAGMLRSEINVLGALTNEM
jgi:hypothetical protein